MGSARTDQNFTSVNEDVTLDGVVYFFSFEFTNLLTLFKDHFRRGSRILKWGVNFCNNVIEPKPG